MGLFYAQKVVNKVVNFSVNFCYILNMKKETIERIIQLKREIQKLPSGSIFTKRIKGNTYYYHQWSNNGDKCTQYVKEEDLEKLSKQIDKRKQLELELKMLKKGVSVNTISIYTLMHKNTKVIELLINNQDGFIFGFGDIHNASYLPVGTYDGKSLIANNLSEWWNNRSIPLSRSGIRNALNDLDINSTQILLLRCCGLSLSDQYWIKARDDNDISWEKINFFDNDFSNDVGDILFGDQHNKNDLNLSSPDNTSVGNLKKRWRISNGKRILIKGGSNPFRQEPYNEVVASLVASTLDIPCIKYCLLFDKEYPYCECPDFVSKNNDFVPAYQIIKTLKKNNSDSAYTHFIKCSEHLGIKNAIDYINKMIVFDFIIANEDRHYNNFGFIRNTDTLSFEEISPLFDNGASFGFDKISEDIKPFMNIESKPFKSNPVEQLDLVTDYSWLTVEKLEKAKEIVSKFFKDNISKYLDANRVDQIINSTAERIEYLKSKIS